MDIPVSFILYIWVLNSLIIAVVHYELKILRQFELCDATLSYSISLD